MAKSYSPLAASDDRDLLVIGSDHFHYYTKEKTAIAIYIRHYAF